MVNPAPVIGKWYARPGGNSFEVVAIDRDDRSVEIQYFDGAVEELDLDEWQEETIEEVEAPEDWTGSVDVDPEDYENEFEAEPSAAGGPAEARLFVDRREAEGYSEIELPEADDADRY